MYGLPFNKTRGTSLSSTSTSLSSPSLLLYQLYALNVLRYQSNIIPRANTTFSKPIPLTIQSTQFSSSRQKIKEKQRCFTGYRARCFCVLFLLLILFLIPIILSILASNFPIHFSSCSCPIGYEQSSTSKSCTCIDRNECLNGAGYHTCTGLNMQCINTMGSYICRCRMGFTREKDQDFCVDIDECDLYKPCNTSISACINLPGRYYCQCLTSTTNDDECVPRNVCAEQSDLCGPHSECVVSSSNGYICEVKRRDESKETSFFLLSFSLVSSRSCEIWQ